MRGGGPFGQALSAVENTRLVTDPRSPEKMDLLSYLPLPLSSGKRGLVFWNQLKSQSWTSGPCALVPGGALGGIWELAGLAG